MVIGLSTLILKTVCFCIIAISVRYGRRYRDFIAHTSHLFKRIQLRTSADLEFKLVTLQYILGVKINIFNFISIISCINNLSSDNFCISLFCCDKIYIRRCDINLLCIIYNKRYCIVYCRSVIVESRCKIASICIDINHTGSSICFNLDNFQSALTCSTTLYIFEAEREKFLCTLGIESLSTLSRIYLECKFALCLNHACTYLSIVNSSLSIVIFRNKDYTLNTIEETLNLSFNSSQTLLERLERSRNHLLNLLGNLTIVLQSSVEGIVNSLLVVCLYLVKVNLAQLILHLFESSCGSITLQSLAEAITERLGQIGLNLLDSLFQFINCNFQLCICCVSVAQLLQVTFDCTYR